MLWYKAWFETRTLFLICLVTITALAWFPVYSDSHPPAGPTTHIYFILTVAHGGYQILGGLWLIAVVFLTVGGLLREQAVGASGFTLALPFSRARLMSVRIGVILIELLTIVFTSTVAICLEERVLGVAYPLSQIGFHLVLLLSGGMVFFGIALLIASLVRGEYTAPLISFCIVLGIALSMRDPPAQDYSPFHFMGGAEYFDRPTGLLTGPIPWEQAAVWLLVSAALLAASVKAIQLRDL